MTNTRRVGSYMSAIHWIVRNEELDWLGNSESMSVTACLVADIFHRKDEEVINDLRNLVEKNRKYEERSKSAQEGIEQARAYARSVIDDINKGT